MVRMACQVDEMYVRALKAGFLVNNIRIFLIFLSANPHLPIKVTKLISEAWLA